ncbi:serine/threonine protein kinase [Tamaricihabitans halophyticus]|uniref:non-specific serine/threonine protein kinase n=1 Tax=Tamaricihabitans halophyticus TaxID=1262583 RepID=A0A4R2QL21_9PSEU|nr:serine/threonine-protein kinase [Tamaricihabitans halophyticus]TCP50163.1 serine/threonine protein kinase [Tamaricihabitans halophyticus]
MSDHPTQPVPPRIIADRYTLLAELGRGGTGVVWRALDQVIDREVAIKELRSVDRYGAERDGMVFAERVLREVRTGGRLNDPAVVAVHDVVVETDATYIVMELVAAPTLSELVAQRGPLPGDRAAEIGEQLLAALDAAHQAGIVHRDVKPGNVLVLDDWRVKLTDFGIARAVDDPQLTTSGMLVGSPAFIAPERLEGAEASPASDLWSLGATLYFAVEGLPAFERSTAAATLHAVLHEVPYLSRASGPLASVISGLLVTSATARMSTEQARGLLRTAAAERVAPVAAEPRPMPEQSPMPLATGPHPVRPEPGRHPGRHRWRYATAATVAAIALVFAGGLLDRILFAPTTDPRSGAVAPGGQAQEPDSPALAEVWTYGEGGDIPFFYYPDLDSGSCIREVRRYGNIEPEDAVDCAEPHAAEVFTTMGTLDNPLAGDTFPTPDYPGTQTLAAAAEGWCTLYFTSNQVRYKDKQETLRYRAVVPSRQHWLEKSSGGASPDDVDRRVFCFVDRADGGQLDGSVLAERN